MGGRARPGLGRRSRARRSTQHVEAVAAAVAGRGGAGGIALTHGHPDHAEGLDALRSRLGGAPVGAMPGAARRRRVRAVHGAACARPCRRPPRVRRGRRRVHGRRGAGRGQRLHRSGRRLAGGLPGRPAPAAGARPRAAVPRATGRSSRIPRRSSTSTSRTGSSASAASSPRSTLARARDDELLAAAWDEIPEGLRVPAAWTLGGAPGEAAGGGTAAGRVWTAAVTRPRRRRSSIRRAGELLRRRERCHAVALGHRRAPCRRCRRSPSTRARARVRRVALRLELDRDVDDPARVRDEVRRPEDSARVQLRGDGVAGELVVGRAGDRAAAQRGRVAWSSTPPSAHGASRSTSALSASFGSAQRGAELLGERALAGRDVGERRAPRRPPPGRARARRRRWPSPITAIAAVGEVGGSPDALARDADRGLDAERGPRAGIAGAAALEREPGDVVGPLGDHGHVGADGADVLGGHVAAGELVDAVAEVEQRVAPQSPARAQARRRAA